MFVEKKTTSLKSFVLRSVCLIMGLGKKGLPESFLKSVPYHLELTGSDIALETATAMGVIAEQLRSARE